MNWASKAVVRHDMSVCGLAGDILDGYHPKEEADAALQDLIDIFDTLQRPHWHMIGNHCLYNLPLKVISPPTPRNTQHE